MTNKANFLWVDIETTGLDVNTCRILELAAVATGPDLVPIGKFHQVYDAPLEFLHMTSFVRELHTNNGLFDEVRKAEHACTSLVAQRELLDFIGTHCEEKPTIAGSSVDFDKRFIDHWMWPVSKALHYRIFDARPIQTALELWGGVEKFLKKEAHRAMDDIEETLEHMRTAKALFGTIRPPSRYQGFA